MEDILNEILQWKEHRKTGYNLAVKSWLDSCEMTMFFGLLISHNCGLYCHLSQQTPSDSLKTWVVIVCGRHTLGMWVKMCISQTAEVLI